MTTKAPFTDEVEPINGYFAGGNRSARELGRSAARISPVATSRSRISAAKGKSRGKKGRVEALGPTPERLAKGDISPITAGGFHRSVSAVEKLRDGGKLDHDARTNEAMFQAAEKLRRHFEGCLIGVQAQDLNRVISSGSGDDLAQEENWVHNFDAFRKACRLMGWYEHSPSRGAGRIVVSIVCHELTVRDAAAANLPSARMDAMQVTAMDRLREGLFSLAVHWRML